MRILVVDDERSLLMTLTANLELEGFDVVGAENAAEALELVSTQAFDLLLTDIRMPGMSGVELFKRVRERKPDVPVVLMTAFALEGLVEEAIRSGAFTVLAKPFDVDHMVATLSRALRRPVILVVDDAPDQAETTAAVMRESGLRAQAVYDGESALEALRSGAVDICVVDLVMPGMTGPELIDRVKAMDPTVAFIAVSGHNVPEMMQRMAQRGAFACIQKPFDPRMLMASIARARGRRAPQEVP